MKVESPVGLRALQGRFWRLIAAPQGVAQGLTTVAAEDPNARPLTNWIHAPNESAATERLDVYANMYFFRLLDAIKNQVPRVAAFLGAASFQNLIVDYLLVHPSSDPSLRHAANKLPAFVATHTTGLRRADVADLAALELARNDVFDAQDSAPLDAAVLAALPADAWPALRLALRPSVRLLSVSASAIPLWQALADGNATPAYDDGSSGCVVWRAGHQSVHRLAPEPEFAALTAMATGATFAQVCEQWGPDDCAGDLAMQAQLPLAALVRWLADGIIAAL